MKKIYILSLISALIVIGCTMNNEIKEAGESDLVEVSLAFNGDINVSEAPMEKTKGAETDSRDLYGVQVYQDGQYYAYGLFDNVSNMKLFMHSGSTYKIVCTMIKNGKDLGLFRSHNIYKKPNITNDYINIVNNHDRMEGNPSKQKIVCVGEDYDVLGYSLPFALSIPNKSCYCGSSYNRVYREYNEGTDYYICLTMPLTNSFIYDTTNGMDMLSNGITARSEYDSAQDEYQLFRSKYTGNYRYYGLHDNYSPSSGGVISLNMKHVGFSYQFSINGISDGTVSLSIYNDDITFVNDTFSSDYTSDIRHHTFEHFEDAWKYDDYTENLTVSMSWMRGIGIEQDLGSQVIQIKGNTLNKINIDLSTN